MFVISEPSGAAKLVENRGRGGEGLSKSDGGVNVARYTRELANQIQDGCSGNAVRAAQRRAFQLEQGFSQFLY